MFCGECGTQNPDTNQFCRNCGKQFSRKTAAIPGSSARAAPYTQPAPAPQPAAPAQPLYYYPPAGVQPQAQYSAPLPAAPAVVERQKRTWLGIASLIPAIFSWVFYPYLLGLVTIVLGLISIYLWKRQGTRFPLSAVFSIIIGFLAIVINLFWLDIFPPPQVLPPIE